MLPFAATKACASPPESLTPLAQALRQTPVPGLGPGLGSMPRFRAEVGPFVGFAAAADLRAIDGGYLPSVTSNGGIAGGELAVRAGLGLDGVISESGDGLVFAQLGLRADSPSTNELPATSSARSRRPAARRPCARASASAPACACRIYLFPCDLLLLSPLYFVSPESLHRRWRSPPATAA